MVQGGGITLVRTTHSAAWYFTTYEALKRRGEEGSGGGAILSPLVTMLAGGAAGVVATLSSHPLDVIKSVVQSRQHPCTWSDAVATLCRSHGRWGWAVRGLFPSLARGAVINAVNFLVYEQVAEALG